MTPLDRQGTNVNVGLGERSVRRFSARHAGKISENLGYKLSLQSFSGTDWEYVDPEEIELRDYDLSRNSTELRIDYRPNDDLTAIVSTGYNSADNIELTGLGAGLADGWVSGYYQARVMYKDLFFQAFQNQKLLMSFMIVNNILLILRQKNGKLNLILRIIKLKTFQKK